MSLFAYFGTPESRSFQFLWTAGTQPLFSLAFRLFQRLSHLLEPRAAGGGRALYPGKWNPGPPTPPPGNAGLEDVRGVETTEKLG